MSALDDLPAIELRDYLAAQALIALGTWVPPEDYLDADGFNLPDYSAKYQRLVREARSRWAYAQADAMLAHRDTRKGDENGIHA